MFAQLPGPNNTVTITSTLYRLHIISLELLEQVSEYVRFAGLQLRRMEFCHLPWPSPLQVCYYGLVWRFDEESGPTVQ